jgi:penicillin-binding protein 2
LDRQGKLLADNVPSYSLYLIPFNGDSVGKTLQRLDELLPIAENRRVEMEKRLSQYSFSPIKVADNVDITVRSFLEEHRGLMPGMLIRSEPLRYYRYGRELSHVIGYVGELTPSEKENLSDPTGDEWTFRGRDGLELYYDDDLRGRPGTYFVEVDARGREIGDFRGREPVHPQRGADIQLTIDVDLQLEAYNMFPEDKKGALLCLDPRNGEIFVMVSRPDFDPNILVTGVSSVKWKEMVDDPGSPMFNRVSKAGYPPGSTFKLAIALIALEKGIVDLNFKEPIPCLGGLQYGNRWFGCWREEGHGSLDLYQAIVQSCDSYFYQLGNRMGLEEIVHGARNLGFATVTGVDLPNENKGFVPDKSWYDRRYGQSGWGRGVTLNLSIGQGELLVTPIQLAVFYSMIANGGRVVHPHFVFGEDNSFDPQVVLPERLLEPLQKSLAGVVLEEKGTARYAGMLSGIEMAGKTGTAQNPHGDDHSIFVGYAPVTRPEVLAVAIIEGAGHGSSVAAPLVGQLLRRYFEFSEGKNNPEKMEGAT